MNYVDTIGDKLEGCACRFNQRAIPGRFMGQPGCETISARGAFRRTVLETEDIVLCVAEHGSRPAASTRNGTLILQERADELYFTAWPESCLAGWQLVRAVSSGAMRAVSFAAYPETISQVGDLRVVSRYSLHDVTICTAGAQRGCYVKLTTKAELAAARAAKVARAAAESAAAGRVSWQPSRPYIAREPARPYVALELSRPYRFAF
jgi:phage head maturation protease